MNRIRRNSFLSRYLLAASLAASPLTTGCGTPEPTTPVAPQPSTLAKVSRKIPADGETTGRSPLVGALLDRQVTVGVASFTITPHADGTANAEAGAVFWKPNAELKAGQRYEWTMVFNDRGYETTLKGNFTVAKDPPPAPMGPLWGLSEGTLGGATKQFTCSGTHAGQYYLTVTKAGDGALIWGQKVGGFGQEFYYINSQDLAATYLQTGIVSGITFSAEGLQEGTTTCK